MLDRLTRRGHGLARFASLGLALAGVFAGSLTAQDGAVDFNRDVRPILSDRCFKCHGFDAKARKANLRLDTAEGMTRAHDGRRAVVPGRPAESELLRRIDSTDPGIQMPPPDSGLTLDAEDRALLRRWIAEGADYAPHWAFVAPPPTKIPAVSDRGWGRNAIDNFVLARLARAGLEPSAEADRETLLRRLTLDLTGIPPTLGELDSFIADNSANAYERAVDRLLASPRFGERLALVWLDVARYADTNGFHHDNLRTGWPYRDWVIRAFNDNLPFDRFVTEQLAGDLLPEPTEQQRIASAFCRMHNINDEGGALDPEYRVEAVCDRIETIATTFMGLTFTCCRCHDHKYDPFTQEDYYSLFAFFNSVEERGVYPANFEQARAYPARLLFKTPELREKIAAAARAVAAAQAERDAATPAIDAERDAWERAFAQQHGISWVDAETVSASASEGVQLTRQPDGSYLASGANPDKDTHTFVLRTDAATDLRILRLEALPDPKLPDGRVGRPRNGNAVVTAIRVRAVARNDANRTQDVEWAWAWADHEQQNGDFDVVNLLQGTGEGWALQGHGDKLARNAILLAKQPFGFEGGTDLHVSIEYRSRYARHTIGRPRVSIARSGADLNEVFPLVASDWWLAGPFKAENFDEAYDTEFGPENAKTIDRGAKFGKVGWKHKPDIADGKAYPLRGAQSAFYVARTLHTPTPRSLDLSLGSDDSIRVSLNGSEVFQRKVFRGVRPDQEKVSVELRAGENLLVVKIINGGGPGGFYGRHIQPLEAPTRFGPAALIPAERRGEGLAARFRNAWNTLRSPTWARLDSALSAAEKQLAEREGAAVPVLVMQEKDEATPTFVLERGHYEGANKERPVQRRPPEILGTALPAGAPLNRLGFAQWLTQVDHPLTARVHVNRIWQMLFGTGIVETTEDFGQQSEWPSHPRLLDWLARDFAEHGWDQKRLIKQLAMSATYRQVAVAKPDARAIDPRNRLLAYFPRRRLPAETVRDLALFASGLLIEELGGPSVRPYQPAGLWREVSIGGSSNTQVFKRDEGDSLYRRSLYTFWKRTSPSPQMTTFNAPSREFCVVRRGTTNTPLQTLVLWNDEQFVEAARSLAVRVLETEGDDTERLRQAFRRCTGRTPGANELSVLQRTLDDFRTRYDDATEDAKALLEVGTTPLPEGYAPTELAAWTMIGNTLLSLDETIVRD